MTKRVDALRHETGFTIIEVMVGAMLLVIGLIGTLALFDTSNRLSAQNKNRVGAVNLARQVAEDIRSLSYDRIDSTNIEGDLVATGLTDEDVTLAGIQVLRGPVTYTVTVIKTSSGNTTSPCVLDSATDGVRAATDTAFYCGGSPNAGSTTPADGNPDDFRRVEVTVTWPGPQGTASCSGLDNGAGRSCVMQSVLVQNPSGGIGPSIDTITLLPTGLTINTEGTVEGPDAPTNLTFNVTTRAAADEVHWTADDGVSQGVATGSNKTWTFTWSLPSSLRDGPHTISVQAFLLGSGGPAKPKVVQINLKEPAAPDEDVSPLPTAGVNERLNRNSPVNQPAVEFKWSQNPETDIRGYNVYKSLTPTGTAVTPGVADPLVCTTVPKGVSATSCVAPLSAAEVSACDALDPLPCPQTYYIVGIDSRWTARTNNNPLTCTSPLLATIDLGQFTDPDRPGCASTPFNVDINAGRAEIEPTQPTALTPGTSNGLPTLTWGASSPGGSDTIAFYRIYRDPSNPPQYSERIGTTQDGTTLTFTDPNPTAATHTYAVTAVDTHYQESDPTAPVTWP